MAQTYYELLGVHENATDAEIEAAFKSKAREVHPDSVGAVNPYLQKVAAEAFKQLSEAKSVLLDRSKRQRYDASLAYVRWSAHGTTAAAPPEPSPQASPAPSQPPQSPSPPPPTSRPPAQPPSSLWGRRTRLGAHPFIVGGSAFLFIIFLAMLFTGGFRSLFLSPDTKPPIATGSQSTVAPAAPARGPASGSPAKNHNPQSRSSAPSRPGTLSPREKSANAGEKTISHRPDLSGLGAPERQSIESVCAHAKYTAGPAAYDRCLEDQLAGLPSAPRRPDLSGLSEPERLSIESACSHAKYMEGPAAYNRCLQDQLGALASAPRRPDLSSLSPDEQKSIESSCSRAKYVEGPAAYNTCLVHQLERLKNRRP